MINVHKELDLGSMPKLNKTQLKHKRHNRVFVDINERWVKLSFRLPLSFEGSFRRLPVKVKDNRRKKPKGVRAKPTTHYQRFQRDVFEMGGYRCAKCGKVYGKIRLTAHHLWSISKYPDWGFDPDGSRPLCLDCHCKFHEQYGYLDFTPEDFFEFISTNEDCLQHDIKDLPWWYNLESIVRV